MVAAFLLYGIDHIIECTKVWEIIADEHGIQPDGKPTVEAFENRIQLERIDVSK